MDYDGAATTAQLLNSASTMLHSPRVGRRRACRVEMRPACGLYPRAPGRELVWSGCSHQRAAEERGPGQVMAESGRRQNDCVRDAPDKSSDKSIHSQPRINHVSQLSTTNVFHSKESPPASSYGYHGCEASLTGFICNVVKRRDDRHVCPVPAGHGHAIRPSAARPLRRLATRAVSRVHRGIGTAGRSDSSCRGIGPYRDGPTVFCSEGAEPHSAAL